MLISAFACKYSHFQASLRRIRATGESIKRKTNEINRFAYNKFLLFPTLSSLSVYPTEYGTY